LIRIPNKYGNRSERALSCSRASLPRVSLDDANTRLRGI
jgi:hypothetical protein